jgi:riboflavin kinase/FMN adenylyltransferase
MAYIGARLTFNDTALSVEVNLFDFDEDVKSGNAVLELTGYVRPPEKFKSTDQLAEQMKHDESEVRRRLSTEILK